MKFLKVLFFVLLVPMLIFSIGMFWVVTAESMPCEPEKAFGVFVTILVLITAICCFAILKRNKQQ